jgi:hypothetical protein
MHHMTNALEQHIGEYHHWRDQLTEAINEYRDWLDLTGAGDALVDLRLYDMAESVKNDRLVLAFVAEFARGKTETINALFFSDFKQRLLPCDAGRTTMCPTEIFWDPNEEPYIKLLPIETRKQDESLVLLKKNPHAWSKLRLDMHSTSAMKETLNVLVEQKKVPLEEARRLGLWNDDDMTMVQSLKSSGLVDVPIWRHAMINFPHPLLKSGLVILDTPGLNTLGTEPELTINIIPNAHAVIFLLATDTGVTRSDMEIWSKFIRGRTSRKLAVLNKIDILWDELKTEDEIQTMIQSQVANTARQLGLPPQDVFAISAQKALLAKVKGDRDLLKRSGIEKVEHILAEGVVATKHEVLRRTIVTDVGNMVKESRKAMQQRIGATRAQLEELASLRGQNRSTIQDLLSKVSADRKVYEESIRTFTQGNQKIAVLGDALMQQLNLQQLDVMLDNSRKSIGESWTTHGLNMGMKALIKQVNELATRVSQQGIEIKEIGNELYRLFHAKHGFEARTPPSLDLSPLVDSMSALQKTTEEFCSDPVNVMTEKHFLIRKFFFSLGAQAHHQFEVFQHEAQLWLKGLLAPLKLQISDHKAQLDKRTESLMQVHENMESLQQRIAEIEADHARLQREGAMLDQTLLKLIKVAQQAVHKTPA